MREVRGERREGERREERGEKERREERRGERTEERGEKERRREERGEKSSKCILPVCGHLVHQTPHPADLSMCTHRRLCVHQKIPQY